MPTSLSPAEVGALLQRGQSLLQSGRYHEAATVYADLERCCPDEAAVLNGKAILLNKTGRIDDAIAVWRRLLDRHPDMAAPLINIGLAQRAAGRVAEAMASFTAALAMHPGLFDAHFNLGATYLIAGRHTAAIDHFMAALAARPGHVRATVLLAQAAQNVCDWDRLDAAMPVLQAEIAKAREGQPCAITPWHALRLPMSRQDRLAIATVAARAMEARAMETQAMETQAGAPAAPRPQPRPAADGRLTIGYISGDFRTHPLMQLTAGLFRRHDRTRFRILAYPVKQPDAAAARILQEGCDGVTDLSGLDDPAAAARIRADGVDILVDLSGFNQFMRPGILAFRPAPVQVHYLSFAGSLGGRLHDYLIGDDLVTPPEHAADYAETVLRLPGCYQINDGDQQTGPAITRAQAGLPETGTVFACFCSADKIERDVFARWMAVLAAVPGSVLWLFGDSAALQDNLRRAATAAGIAPGRLVFAGWLPKAEHLARIGLADLHFDTGTYGAHTTGSDALWAGVPLLTVPGDSFASRVGASLLQAAGLPELICADWDAFQALAIALGQDADRRAALRHRLQAGRDSCDLFNTAKTVRGLEALYQQMWDERLTASGIQPAISSSIACTAAA